MPVKVDYFLPLGHIWNRLGTEGLPAKGLRMGVKKTFTGLVSRATLPIHTCTFSLSCFFLLAGCVNDISDNVNPNSEIARSVQDEYRRFVARAEGDLGVHKANPDGTISRTSAYRGSDSVPRIPSVVEALPRGNGPADAYWETGISRQQTIGSRVVKVRIEDLMNRMLNQSNQLAAFSDIPLIRQTVVSEAEGQFETYVFADGEAESNSAPRSSLLETGTSSTAPDTLKENRYGVEFGVGKPLITGGELTLSQRLGTRHSNSEFFVPDKQADAELLLEIRQPLLDGAGIAVNSAPIQLATLERDRSVVDLQRQIEDQMTEVIRTYWTLYAERSRVLQRYRLVTDLQKVAERITARESLDTLPSEAIQANAAVRKAAASIIRAQSGVDNNEARLSALLSDPTLYGDKVEIIPTQRPVRKYIDVPLEDVAVLALQNRPEVKSAALQVRAAELQSGVAKNKLLPDLDLYAGVSNQGLAADDRVGVAFGDQFDQTDVDAVVGFRFRMPIGNKSDKAIYERRRLEIRQQTSQLRNVSDTVLLETQIAVRETRSAYQEMQARLGELKALNSEIDALEQRAEEGLEGGNAFLATLISAYENRAQSEEGLMEATVGYNLALYGVERAAGTMLIVRGIEARRVKDGELDYVKVVRTGGSSNDNADNFLNNPKLLGQKDRGAEQNNGQTSQQ